MYIFAFTLLVHHHLFIATRHIQPILLLKLSYTTFPPGPVDPKVPTDLHHIDHSLNAALNPLNHLSLTINAQHSIGAHYQSVVIDLVQERYIILVVYFMNDIEVDCFVLKDLIRIQ